MLEQLFRFRDRHTSPGREVLAGLTTFMTMAYILFVNPQILSGAGVPVQAAAAATCLGAAVPTLLMGLWTNYPLALASGMGLNAALVASALQRHVSWQTMMGVIVVEGLLVLILVLTGVREAVMIAIPHELKCAIGVGIGLFIALIGLQKGGWVSLEGGLLHFGSLAHRQALVATMGLILTAALLVRRVPGALLIGLLLTTGFAALADRFGLGIAEKPLISMPSFSFQLPSFETVGAADVRSALQMGLWAVIFAFLLTDFFDTMGTVIAVGKQGGFLTEGERLPKLNRVLLVDSFAAAWGGFCGCSSVTSYIESAAGVAMGGRTGLTSVVVGLLFLLSLIITPLVGLVPSAATAPVLVLVGFLMMSIVQEIEWHDYVQAIPAFLIILFIPLTFSITHGLGVGFIAYGLLALLSGRGREIHPVLYVIALLFTLNFLLELPAFAK